MSLNYTPRGVRSMRDPEKAEQIFESENGRIIKDDNMSMYS